MFDVLSAINWLSIPAAFAAYFLLGPLWYMLLFPKTYAASLGREQQAAQQKMPAIFIVGPAVCALVITIACALLIYALDIVLYSDALAFAAVVGVGYLLANTVNVAINPNIPRPFLYGAVTGGYHMVGMLLVNVILVAMK